MIQEYRCPKCHQLLFKGSLKLLLSKKATPESFVEPQCPKCGKRTRFAYQPERQVIKGDEPSSLFEVAA